LGGLREAEVGVTLFEKGYLAKLKIELARFDVVHLVWLETVVVVVVVELAVAYSLWL
jgi:hypothetical protein